MAQCPHGEYFDDAGSPENIDTDGYTVLDAIQSHTATAELGGLKVVKSPFYNAVSPILTWYLYC